MGSCCPKIRIFSLGLMSQLYPSLIGVYTKINISSSSHDKRQLYRMAKPDAQFYISRPTPSSNVVHYSWRVNNNTDTLWGYIRSSSSGVCPTMGGRWRVFDKTIKKWRNDFSLSVTCWGLQADFKWHSRIKD